MNKRLLAGLMTLGVLVTPLAATAQDGLPVAGSTNGASAPIDTASASAVQLVAASTGKAIYVTQYNVIAAGTTNVTLEYGTGSNCATGTTTLTGAYPLTAQAGFAIGSGIAPLLYVPAGKALCVLNSQAIQISGAVTYVQKQ